MALESFYFTYSYLSLRTFVCVGDPHTLAIVALKLPAMERALDAVSHHSASHRQVGPQVRAVGVHHVGLPIEAPEHSHLLP